MNRLKHLYKTYVNWYQKQVFAFFYHHRCKILPEVRGGNWRLKNLWIFLQGFPFVFHRLFHPFKEQKLIKTISIYADDDFSPLRRYIFRYRNMFI